MLLSLVTLPLPSRMVSVYMLLPKESSLLLSLKLPIAMGADGVIEHALVAEDVLNANSEAWLETSATELLL